MQKEKDRATRWRGLKGKREKMERVAASARGVGGKEAGGNPRVWRLGGVGPDWATLSRLKFYFSFANLIWQLILENGDGKTFPTNLAK